MRTVASEISQLVDAYKRCQEQGNAEWESRHAESIRAICKEHLPSGSGIDNGTKIDLDASEPDRLVFLTAYHHMNEGGMYDGWTEHKVIVTPRLMDHLTVHITGRNRNDIKEYLHEVYGHDLRAEFQG